MVMLPSVKVARVELLSLPFFIIGRPGQPRGAAVSGLGAQPSISPPAPPLMLPELAVYSMWFCRSVNVSAFAVSSLLPAWVLAIAPPTRFT